MVQHTHTYALCRPYTPTSPLPPELLPSQTPPPPSFFGKSWKKAADITNMTFDLIKLNYPTIISKSGLDISYFFQLCSWSSPPFNFSSPFWAASPPSKPSWSICQWSKFTLPAACWGGRGPPCSQQWEWDCFCSATNLHLCPQRFLWCWDQLLPWVSQWSRTPTKLTPRIFHSSSLILRLLLTKKWPEELQRYRPTKV